MKGILFDLDGTLIDSMEVWAGLSKNFIKEKVLKLKEGIEEHETGLAIEELPVFIKETYGLDVSIEEITDYITQTLVYHCENVFEYKEGAKEMIKAFKDRGYKMCITTASPDYYCDLLDKKLGLSQHMEFIQTPDKVGIPKSNKDYFKKAVESLGTDPAKTYVFDDALYAIKNAKAQGLIPIGVADKSAESEKEEIKEIAHIFLETYVDLDMDKFL